MAKSKKQIDLAMQQRKANAIAKEKGLPLPFPNPWDELMEKLPQGASEDDKRRWIAKLADRYAPKTKKAPDGAC